MMDQFCKDVLDFLQSVYSDAYEYKIRRWVAAPNYLVPGGEKVELTIKINTMYRLIVTQENMNYLFNLYKGKEYIEERKWWLWQKELIDMIEGS